MQLSTFNKKYGMQKKVVVCHSPELFKREVTAHVRMGVPAINCEGYAFTELVSTLLREYKTGQGEYYEEAERSELIGMMLACALEVIRDHKLSYFKESMIDSGTAKQLLEDVQLLRKEGKLESLKDHPDSKLADVYQIAMEFIRRLQELDLYDEIRILGETNELAAAGDITLEAEVVGIYGESREKFTALERQLWENFIQQKTVEQLERIQINSDGEGKKQFFKVFGLHNEIHAVVKDVLERKIPWEQVQIISCTNAGFYPMLTYLQQLKIPYCMPEGISEDYSYPASSIKKFLENPANFFIDSEGNVNVSELFLGLADRLDRLAAIPQMPQPTVLSLLGKAGICRKCATYYGFEAEYHLAVRMAETMLLGGRIVEDRREEGAIYIGSLGRTEMVFRPYVYLLGFESRNYPGTQVQSPVLLDMDKMGLELPQMHLSARKTEELEEKLRHIMASPAELITISYVSYDTVNMREQNPSSFYQKLFEDSDCEEQLFDFREEESSKVLEAREQMLL